MALTFGSSEVNVHAKMVAFTFTGTLSGLGSPKQRVNTNSEHATHILAATTADVVSQLLRNMLQNLVGPRLCKIIV